MKIFYVLGQIGSQNEELHSGSVYYKHRPRQIDKKNYTPYFSPRQRKNCWSEQPMSTVSLR